MRRPRRYFHRRYHDPDPSITLLIALGIGVFGLVSWTNPNFLNNIMFFFNPELRELEEEKVKAQREMFRLIFLIVVICAGIYLLMWWSKHKKKKKEPRYPLVYTYPPPFPTQAVPTIRGESIDAS